MKTAAVIIPTTGRESLNRAYESVIGQVYNQERLCVLPIVVPDGPRAYIHVLSNCDQVPAKFDLPYPTGENYWNGHRIYGAVPFLLPHDYIFYLDDDNEYHPDHVASCINLCESRGLDWCHSFREIYDGDKFICRDECESLGQWPVWFNKEYGHIDTSCYCLKREVAVAVAPIWHRPAKVDGKPVTSPDTLLANALMKRYPRFGCTGRFTVKYRIGSQDITPKAEFFLQGNEEYRAMYPQGLPWETAQ